MRYSGPEVVVLIVATFFATVVGTLLMVALAWLVLSALA